MKMRITGYGALLLASVLLACGCEAAAEEKRVGDLIYVPAMTVEAQAGAISLRVEGLAIGEESDEPVSVPQLAGAEFGVYVVSSSGALVPWANPLYPSEPMRIRTGEEETRFSLPQGTEFFLRQESAPEGYLFDAQTLIPVTGEEIVVRNAMAGRLVICAQDTLGQPVAGAQFAVTAADGSRQTLTADENGEAVLICGQAGVYDVMETALPEGVFEAIALRAGRETDIVRQDDVGMSVSVSEASCTRVTFEHPAPGAVQLSMQLAVIGDDAQTVLQPLAGVRMDIVGGETLVTDETGTAQASLMEGTYTVRLSCEGDAVLPVGEGMMIVESGSTTLIELTATQTTGRVMLEAACSRAVTGGSLSLLSDETGEAFGPYAMDQAGVAVSQALPAGLYHAQIVPPDQTQLGSITCAESSVYGQEELVITVDAGQVTRVGAELLTQEKLTAELLISQVGESGETGLTRMTDSTGLQLLDESGAPVQSLWAENGYLTIEALSGVYTLALDEQKAASMGVMAQSLPFALPSQEETITFVSGATRLMITSVDESGMPVAGATYSVVDSEGNRVTVTTDENGEAVTPLLTAGEAVIETVEAPQAHDIAPEMTVGATAGEAARVQVTHPSYGTAVFSLRMQRLDERGEIAQTALAGAQVDILRDGVQGEPMMTLTAGEDGMVSAQMEPGSYTAVIDGASVGAGCSAGEPVHFSVENVLQTENTLLAYDALGGVRVELAGGELTDEEMAQVRFELTGEDGARITLTGQRGALYAGGLKAGAYVLCQTQMPQGYTLGEPRTVMVRGGEVTVQAVPLEEYAVLTVSKTGLTFSDSMQTFVVPLSGEYAVFTSEDGAMKPYPSEQEQLTVWSNVTPEQVAQGRAAQLRLPAALEGTTYYLLEITPAQGFAQDSVYHEVTLTAGAHQTLECTVSSDRGFFSFDQLDAATGAHVGGGTFELLDAETMEPVLSFTLGETAYRNPMAIGVGAYVLRQVKAADGYAMSEPAWVTIEVEPYLTQGGTVAKAELACAPIPQDGTLGVIEELYAADEQGLTLVCVSGGTMSPGETLVLPQMTLSVSAEEQQRSDIRSVLLDGAGDARGNVYRARVEYCLADGGWQPSDARMSDVLSAPAAVSLADVTDDVIAVRVTYVNDQTGEERAGEGFTPGRVTVDVHAGAQHAVAMRAQASFTGIYAYTLSLSGEEMAMMRGDSSEIGFEAQGAGLFETVPAGRDGRITGAAFFDEDADGVMDAAEQSRYAGMTVSLFAGTGEVVGTCRTDAQGRYRFDGLSSGVYSVQFEAGEEVVFSSGALGSAQMTSGVLDTHYGLSEMLTIDGSHTDYVVNAGCLYASSLNGVVLERMAGGVHGGFGGLSVEMRPVGAPGDEEPLLVVTDEMGAFVLSSILPGDYEVRIEVPDGYLCDEAENGVITRSVSFAQGDRRALGEVVLERAASVEGAVRIDEQGSGAIGPQSPALDGVGVQLLAVADGHTQTVAQTTTGADGRYAFDRLPSGVYSVLFELPDGWAFTRYGSGSMVYGAAALSGSTENFTLEPGQTLQSMDAGVTIPASLTVAVFKDEQLDGQKGVYEPMLSDVGISLIRVENGEDAQQMTCVTGEDGLAVFDSVSPGEYVIAYQMPGAWRSTRQVDPETTRYPVSCVPQSALSTGRSDVFTLSMGEKDAQLFIGAMLSGSISGVVYYDDDADAQQDDQEAAGAGMQVELLDAQGQLLTQQTTDELGAYAFEGLAPGRYTVRFTAPQGCGFSATERTMTRGSVQESNESISSTRPITVASGTDVTTANAGIVRLGAVSGVIWQDSNADRAMDPEEAPMAGVQVALMNGTGRNILATATTDANGQYAFGEIRPGEYLLRVSAPEGYVFSGALTSGVLPVESERDGRVYTSPFTLLGGAQVDNTGFGLYTQGAIRGRIWQDTDFDGVMAGTEEGLRGATLTLLNTEGEQVARAVSPKSGEFAFEGLAPGEYALQISLTEGYVFTRAGGDSLSLETGETTDQLALGVLEMGQAIEGVGIGALKPAGIGGIVWMDADNDGRRQVGDTGLAQLAVNLETTDGAQRLTTWTDAAGAYRFDGVLPGSYTLTFTLPQGCAFAKNSSGQKRVSCVPQVDALIGATDAFDVVSGVNLTDMDVGVVGVGTIEGTVWEDAVYDGVYASGERGVSGATVELVETAAGRVAASVQTGEDGRYRIDFVRTGEYTVRVTLPQGMIFTCEGEGAIAAVDAAEGETKAFTLAMGEGRQALDVGSIAPAKLEGSVFVDEHEDGERDDGDAGLPGAVITLMQGGTVVATAETDANGAYRFDTVRPGTYRVRVALPEDALFARCTTLTLQHPDAQEGETPSFALDMGQQAQLAPAAAVRASSIGGIAWSDDDADGHIGSAEPALTGTVAELIALDDAGAGTVVAQATVDENGAYAFRLLRSGAYAVRFTLPEGMLFADCTGDAQGSSVPVVPGNTGETETMALAMGENRLTVHVGGILPGEIGDTVWLDTNANGLQDYKEPLIPGVALTLLRVQADGSWQETARTVSDAYGYYRFAGLRPGTYVLCTQVQDGQTLTQRFGKPLGEIDSDLDPGTGMSEPITLRSGERLRNIDVGFTQYGN